jgi:hypothetical protein
MRLAIRSTAVTVFIWEMSIKLKKIGTGIAKGI